MSDPGIPPRRIPVVALTTIVTIAAVVAIAVGVNRASTATVPTPTPAPTATPSPTPNSIIPFADCAAAKFGPALGPLNAPGNVHVYAKPPAFSINVSKLYRATITTKRGTILLCLQPKLAPNTVNNFVVLARNRFYDGIPFHRVVPGFVIQGGDPDCIGKVPPSPSTPSGTCGRGGPGYKFNDEPVHQKYVAGCVAMANSGVNTNGSQFFICIADDTSQLQNLYNLFGKVQSGLDVAQKIQQGDLMESVTVSESQ